MADDIDEAAIIAWIDGELNEQDSGRVAAAIVAHPALAAVAERHRRMQARFAAAFGPIADEPVAAPAAAPVISLAAVRAERAAVTRRPSTAWHMWSGAIAASLVIGVLLGHQLGGTGGVGDRKNALALSSAMSKALDRQLSGEGGAVRIALSFRDRDDHLCRSFSGENLSGVACHEGGEWQLRYGTSTPAETRTDYRMAGTDAAKAQVIEAMIAGDPLNRNAEEKARSGGWGK